MIIDGIPNPVTLGALELHRDTKDPVNIYRRPDGVWSFTTDDVDAPYATIKVPKAA